MMRRVLPALLSGIVAVSLPGCLDRGGLDPEDRDGGTGGRGDGATGGTTGPATGGATNPGTGGAGASGTGGNASTGGRTGTGGATATGGAGANQGSGGAVMGSGGSRGTGGVTATGGAKGTGGVRGTGGNTMCGPVCDIYCQYGNVIDANGCPTCKCNPGPICPAIGCATPCPTGYVKDGKGCDTCICYPDPQACTLAECGAMPLPPYVVQCPNAASAGDAAATTPGMGAAPIVAAPTVCQRNASGVCEWQVLGCKVCPGVACALACPNGFQVGAAGCPICACKAPPAPVCSTFVTSAACGTNSACTWLAPGCAEPALAVAGCFVRANVNCTSDVQCGSGHQCLKRVVNPCTNLACTSCASTVTVCQ